MANKTPLFDKYTSRVDGLTDERFFKVNNELFNGKNTILRMTKKGSSVFDPTWINELEDCLYDLGQIITNPKEVTSQESSVVPIELAKKVDGASVQHLASHTQYIKDINEAGEVIPAKILSHFNKEELHTYENRFIATFIRRLVLFVEKRYEFIKNTVNLETNDVLMMKNSTTINGQEVEIETKISIKKEVQDDVNQTARDYIARIELMREYFTYYYNSPFMKEMKNEKDVRKPILQTNIIRKNPLYRKCYKTFMFIEKFESLGVSYKVDELYQTYDEEERKKLTYLLTAPYLAVADAKDLQIIKENSRTYKPKLLSSIDDEKFSYGDLLEGPIEFVRVDPGYKEFLRKLIPTNIPLHPSKAERDYYSDEIRRRRMLLEDIREIDKLIARVAKDIEVWEKNVQKLIEAREQEAVEAAQRELEALRNYYESLIEEKRQKIIKAAGEQQLELDKLVEQEEEAKEEARKADVNKIYYVSGQVYTRQVDGHLEQVYYLNKKEEGENSVTLSDEEPKEEDVNGRFIVKTPHGYYFKEGKYVNFRERAHVFDDIHEANQVKNHEGGKVIKL